MRFKCPFELELVKSQYNQNWFLCGQHRPEEEAQRGEKKELKWRLCTRRAVVHVYDFISVWSSFVLGLSSC